MPLGFYRTPARGTAKRCASPSFAFSLIELIGMVAILVILATLLLPRILNQQSQSSPARVMGAVSQAHITDVLTAVQALKSAAAQHCARFGSLACRSGTPFPVAASYDRFDSVLLSEQLLDRPFSVRLGTSWNVRLAKVGGGASGSSVAGAAAGIAPDANASATGTYLLEAIIYGVSEMDARAVNDAIDGASQGANPGEGDSRGNVTYSGGAAGSAREVHIRIMQR